jgi:exonuclease III
MSQDSVYLFNWNVRGLNAKAKQDSVRVCIQQYKPTIVCLQETKLSAISNQIILNTFGHQFVQQHAFLPADGTSSGILLACDENFFSISEVVLGQYSLSATVSMREEGLNWSITVVYGPQLDADKINFLAELENIQVSLKPAWLIIGDFNLIYKACDKNNSRLNRAMMQHFRRLLDKIQVKELPLPGRRFTWAGEGSNPAQTKIDRAFASVDWDLMFESSIMHPLSSACSDHTPLFLLGNEKRSKSSNFIFESYWLEVPGFLEVVQHSWQKPILSSNRLAIFRLKLRRLARDLKRWSRCNVGDIKLQLAVAAEVIFQL